MKLVQDLCVFDLVSTGVDPERDQVLQLACVVLHKDNLLERSVFNSYVKISLLEGNLRHHAELCQVGVDVFKSAPKTFDVVSRFAKVVPKNTTFATSRPLNMFFLKSLFKRGAMVFPFSLDCLDVWTLGYDISVRQGWEKIPSLDSLATYIKKPLLRPQNALEKARAVADFLRWSWSKSRNT